VQWVEALWIEHDKQASLELVCAIEKAAFGVIESGWVRFVVSGGYSEDFANGIDKQSKAAAGTFENEDVLWPVE
jgi:hypothetical protein